METFSIYISNSTHFCIFVKQESLIDLMVTTAIQKKKTTNLLKKLNICKDFYEKLAWSKNEFICGIDEVGRGCLAGPVVVCAVILPQNCRINNLKDSKALTAKQREGVAKKLSFSAYYAFAILDQSEIDDINIWHATLKGMRRALLNLLSVCPKLPLIVTVDAMPLSLSNTGYSNIEIKSFPFGESISKSIAAASILAKVKRDELMSRLDKVVPGYALYQHKGYGTPQHQEALKLNGQSLLHRQSFLKKHKVKNLHE